MQINPISSASFEGKKNAQKQVVITPEQFAEFDDRQLGVLAQAITSDRVNDKKHRKINRAMYYNLPLAGGLAALATSAKASRAGKLSAFAIGTAAWAAGVLGMDMLFGTKHAIENRSSKVREFTKNHPIISTLGTIGGMFALMVAGGRGIAKLADKVLPKIAQTKMYKNLAPKAIKVATGLSTKLENSTILNRASKLATKVPSAIKSFTKTIAKNAPFLLVIGQVAHAVNHRAARERVAMETFGELKNAQEEVRQNIIDSQYADELAQMGV